MDTPATSRAKASEWRLSYWNIKYIKIESLAYRNERRERGRHSAFHFFNVSAFLRNITHQVEEHKHELVFFFWGEQWGKIDKVL